MLVPWFLKANKTQKPPGFPGGFLWKQRVRSAYPLNLFQFIDLLGNGAIDLMDTIAVAAVDLGDLSVFQNHFHHPGTIQLAAVAGNEFLLLHLQILRNAETPGSDDQLISCHYLHVHTEVQTVGGDCPGVAAAVAVDPEGAALIGTGETDVLVSGLEEVNIAQTQSLKFLSQLSQTQEMGQELRFLPTPGIGTAVKGIPVTFMQASSP